MYTLELEQFEGPFHLLLQMIEKEKLDITEISLAKIADGFLKYISKTENVPSEELADFLEIAAKLLLIKSHLLLPGIAPEEETVEDLTRQLKIYRQFLEASKKIGRLNNRPICSFAREKIPLEFGPKISLDIQITSETLQKYFKNLTDKILAQVKLTQKTLKQKVISLKQKVNEILSLIKSHQEFILNHFIAHKEKIEKVVTFLAVLELVKRRLIVINQEKIFGEIIIKSFIQNHESQTK